MMSAYRRYWSKSPPTHLLAAAFMGYERPRKASLDEFAAAIGMMVPHG